VGAAIGRVGRGGWASGGTVRTSWSMGPRRTGRTLVRMLIMTRRFSFWMRRRRIVVASGRRVRASRVREVGGWWGWVGGV